MTSHCAVFITAHSTGTRTSHSQHEGLHYCAAYYSWQRLWPFNFTLLDFTNFRTFPHTLQRTYSFALLSILSKFQRGTTKDDGQSPKNDHSLMSNTIITNLVFMMNNKVSLSTPWTHIWGVKVQLHSFLTFALDGSEWSTSCPSCFTPGERTPVPTEQQTGWNPELGWSDPRAGLVVLENRKKKKNRLHLHRFKLRTVQPVVRSLYWLRYPGSLMANSSYSILEQCINYCLWKQSRTLSAVLSMCSDHWTVDEYDRILKRVKQITWSIWHTQVQGDSK